MGHPHTHTHTLRMMGLKRTGRNLSAVQHFRAKKNGGKKKTADRSSLCDLPKQWRGGGGPQHRKEGGGVLFTPFCWMTQGQEHSA